MKKVLCGIMLAITLTFGLGNLAYAQTPTTAAQKAACQGINEETGGNCTSGGTDISNVLKIILNILSVIAGVAAVIMVMISGFKYITSGGDPQAVSSAKKTLIYAIVGTVVVAFAQLIVHFVLHATIK